VSATTALPARIEREGSPDLALLGLLIKEAVAEHLLAGRRSLESARRAGGYLVHAKALLGHGRFCDFRREYCGLSTSTSCRYMRIFRKYPDDAKFAEIANSTIDWALKFAAGEDDEPAPQKRDEQQAELFSDAAAPMPSDAASRLLAAGIPVEGESEHGRKLRLLLLRLHRERLWEQHTPEALVAELDSRLLKTLEEGTPVWIAWFGELLAAARSAQCARPHLNAEEERRRLAA
jgi:hypothetical protein